MDKIYTINLNGEDVQIGNLETDNHIKDINNPHNVTKNQIGLNNVDNTSDMNKPVSNPQQEVFDTKANVDELERLELAMATSWNNLDERLMALEAENIIY